MRDKIDIVLLFHLLQRPLEKTIAANPLVAMFSWEICRRLDEFVCVRRGRQSGLQKLKFTVGTGLGTCSDTLLLTPTYAPRHVITNHRVRADLQ